ncbi:hypothetical protein DERF_006134 [Dermatophagoides farinae]|uniref:Uncharacterized protein n=1 Tax=Dermatophagoides farinae TaxID=6954 RepID=A0A922I8F5_DERFA|nr:hypothetical protein DERF_006134 [Dermatophagoides farinae]
MVIILHLPSKRIDSYQLTTTMTTKILPQINLIKLKKIDVIFKRCYQVNPRKRQEKMKNDPNCATLLRTILLFRLFIIVDDDATGLEFIISLDND